MHTPSDPIQQRITPLSAIAHLPHCTKETKQQFADLFAPMEIEKGQLLISPNQLNTTVYLLASGMLHQYKKIEGNLQTIRFYLPSHFLGQSGAYHSKLIADYVSAITPCTLYATSHRKILQLCERNPQAMRIIVLLQEQLLKESTELISCLHLQPALKRYQAIQQILGKEIYQIPQQYLASYLAMSRKHLGRLNHQLLRPKGGP
ncbi:MAG: Crp/Fnr family transcriptional regulator [Pedobacter sp.]|nr:MAG: Crp/Fnr family transcriptional regulator [Pedobacter sp.]